MVARNEPEQPDIVAELQRLFRQCEERSERLLAEPYDPLKFDGHAGDTILAHFYQPPGKVPLYLIEYRGGPLPRSLAKTCTIVPDFADQTTSLTLRQKPLFTLIAPRGIEGMIHITKGANEALHATTGKRIGYARCHFRAAPITDSERETQMLFDESALFHAELPLSGLPRGKLSEFMRDQYGFRMNGRHLMLHELVGMAEVAWAVDTEGQDKDMPLTPQPGMYLTIPLLKNT